MEMMRIYRLASVFLSLLWLSAAPVWGEPTHRVVSVSDLHGDYERTVKILTAAGLVDARTAAWVGGSATLVQTGDIADRGPESLRIYRLFHRLSQEAQLSGGEVINLLGNHELMNIQGDERYLSKPEIAAYGGLEEWRKSWSPTGEVGQEVRSRFKAVALVDGVLFAHAGLLPQFLNGPSTLEGVNSAMAEAIREDGFPGEQRLRLLLREVGPLWNRFYSDTDPGASSTICASLSKVLKTVGASRMVVGHTPQKDSNGNDRVNTACKGSLVLGDTAISRAYGGEMSFIEYGPHAQATVFYPGLGDEKQPLPQPPTSEVAALVAAPVSSPETAPGGAPRLRQSGAAKAHAKELNEQQQQPLLSKERLNRMAHGAV